MAACMSRPNSPGCRLWVLAPDIDEAALRTLLEAAYAPWADGFNTPEVTPLVRLDDRLSVLELFHGPTLAFKDVALQLLGQFFDWRLKRTGEKMTILGATSGDTGSAAIEGCRHAAGANVFILYPHERPSEVQRRQMTTVAAPNVHAIAVRGTFDDCQAIVKALFNDADFRKKKALSAVNSINWARIMAQAVYYVQATYKVGTSLNFVVPTGNFGNVYAAYVAKKMGAPIGRLVVASNRNDILTRFLETGSMATRTVEPSLSPSMDIQVSSNFERLLFDVTRDVAPSMASLTKSGKYDVPREALEAIRKTFLGGRASDNETLSAIARVYRDHGYLTDPHTAVGLHVYEQVKDHLDGPTVALACAHPAKFPDAVEKATARRPILPHALADLYDREERFDILPADAQAVKAFIIAKS
jgi:threonine synthase